MLLCKGIMETTTNERDNQTTTAGIKKSYAYHKPSDTSLEKITKIRRWFSEGDTLIQELCPHSRERSHAITQLEDAAMWAIKAVVINDAASVAETN